MAELTAAFSMEADRESTVASIPSICSHGMRATSHKCKHHHTVKDFKEIIIKKKKKLRSWAYLNNPEYFLCLKIYNLNYIGKVPDAMKSIPGPGGLKCGHHCGPLFCLL